MDSSVTSLSNSPAPVAAGRDNVVSYAVRLTLTPALALQLTNVSLRGTLFIRQMVVVGAPVSYEN